MTPIIKTTDLLTCKPILLQIKDHGEKTIKSKVAGFLTKCSKQLGLSFDSDFIETLSEDLIDKYSYESIEDIAECLKKGRQGYYGTSYNKLNMMIISEWMNRYLEGKAEVREKHLKQSYKTIKEPLKVVDYEKFKQRISEKKPKIAKGSKELLDNYIVSACQAMSVETKDLYNGSRKKEVADVRGLVKSYQKNFLKMTREQIKEYWHVCSNKI